VLPPFDEHGHLPPGIHRCTVDELVERFGTGSVERVVETKELREYIDLAQKAGVLRLLVNGSYTTATSAPNDVDVVFLLAPVYNPLRRKLRNKDENWPFLQVIPAVEESDFLDWATFFGLNYRGRPKGVVEVVL
jgi:hypothetical protein